MSRLNEIRAKLITEPVYLLNTFEDIAIRTEPVTKTEPEIKYFAKPKGLDEYQLKYNSGLLAETLLGACEITKEQYDNY